MAGLTLDGVLDGVLGIAPSDLLYVVAVCGVPLALVGLLLFVVVRMRRG